LKSARHPQFRKYVPLPAGRPGTQKESNFTFGIRHPSARPFHDDILIVRGEKKLAREETRGHYHVMERAYGQFERAIRLPAPVENDGAKASYRVGVLTIKSQAARPSRITVDT
jgi:hypothetical protein